MNEEAEGEETELQNLLGSKLEKFFSLQGMTSFSGEQGRKQERLPTTISGSSSPKRLGMAVVPTDAAELQWQKSHSVKRRY